MHVVAFSASVTNWAHSTHTPRAPCRVGAMSSGTTSQVRAASLFLFLLLLLLPPNEHPPPWCAAGDVVVALTISIFTPAGATDAMPPSTGFCLLTASILFLFVALSLPIIKTVYLLQINGHPSPSQPETSIGTELRFGVWGFCVTRSASHHQVCSPLPPLPPVLFLADVLQFWVASTSSPRSHCHNPVC